VCGACHDPHEQTRPADAVRSCAAAGCHDAVDAITPLHRGLDAGVVERCTLCHAAHDARIDRVDCAACHTDGARFAPGDSATFDHARHRTVACTRCHASDRTHGALVAASVEDCRACHHRPQQGAAGVDCAACHSRDDIALEVHRVARVVELSVGRRSRALPFVHANHASVVCSTCHTEGLALSATTVDCASCHEQHHAPDATCRSCHVAAPPSTHPPRVVHTTCAGSGCHDAVPFRERPETREFCLACHQDQVAHEPQGRCVDCHAMPAWRASR
jgi:hypothetical protein